MGMAMDLRGIAKERVKASIWIPGIVALLTLVLGIILSAVQDKIGWAPLIGALIICIAIFFLSMKVLLSQVLPISVEMFEKLQSQVDRYVEKGAITWMIDNEQMAEYEKTNNVNEVWLVTCDLAEDIPDAIFFDVVQKNLERGVRYRYFIPHSLAAQARGMQLVENHAGAGDIRVITLSDDFFFLVSRLDFTIYDPKNLNGQRCGYMGLPLDGTDRFHCSMESQFVDLMIGKLNSLVEK